MLVPLQALQEINIPASETWRLTVADVNEEGRRENLFALL